jgi:sulfoxide reductase heme-binding subunit YedZ
MVVNPQTLSVRPAHAITSVQWLRWMVKPVLFIVCLLPLAGLVWDGVHENLGANPVETIRLFTGDWTLRFLLITLAVTPLRRLTGWNAVIRVRRMLGLFAFFYAALHIISYVWLDQLFMWDLIIEDVYKRPYITVGVTAFMLLLPLALTSTNGMVRRLGGKRWQRLHQLVYVIAILGVVHFWWLVKSDIREPLIYAVVLSLLLGYRLFWALRRAQTSPKTHQA